jgi:hypothetical protein
VTDLPRIFWTAQEKASGSNDILFADPGDDVRSSEVLTSVAKLTPFPFRFFIPLFGRTGGISSSLVVPWALLNLKNVNYGFPFSSAMIRDV